MNLPPSPSQSVARGLLQQCRDAFVAHAADCAERTRSRLLDDTSVADLVAPDIALRADLVARWGEAEAVLRGALVDFCDEQLRFAEDSRVGRPFDFTASSLKLVDDSELEFAIALGDTTARFREASEGELFKLDARLAWLMDLPELDEEHDPLGPVALAYGLRLMLESFNLPLAPRLWLLRLLEGGFLSALPAAYGRINSLLVEQDVLPRISFAIRRRDERAAPGERRDEMRGEGGGRTRQDPLERLRQQAGASHPGVMAGGGGGVMVHEAALRALDASLQSLTRLQRRAAMPDEPGGAAAEWAAIRSGRGAPELAGVDPLTVDIVSRLFDAIAADPDLPAAVADLLAWLQLPILKVALADPAFFNDAGHPARRVLDAIGRIALCLPTTAPQDARAFQAIKAVVGRIRQQFDRDAALFPELAAELEACVAGADLPGSPAASVASRFAAEYGLRTRAEEAAAQVLEGLLKPGLAPAVAEFLDRPWRECLVRAHAHHGQADASGGNWQAWCDAARDLAWSVEPKTAPDQRKRLLATLPVMLRHLNAGLDLIAAPQAQREAFLDALMALHSAAMKPGGAPPQAGAARSQGDALEYGGPGPGAMAEGVRWIAGAADGHDIQFGYLRPAHGVSADAGNAPHPGDCVEFRLPGAAPRRYFLAWSHREPRVLVFAAVGGGQLLVLAPPVFESLRQRGAAALAVPEPLVERAVARALAAATSTLAAATSTLAAATPAT